MKKTKLDLERPRELLFQRAREGADITTDADLAKLMGVTPQTLSQWRQGTVAMTDERVIQMAEIAGDPAELWLLMMRFTNAKSSEARSAWGRAMRNVAAQLDGIIKAGSIVLLLALPFLNPALAYTQRQQESRAEQLTGVCIMRSLRRIAAAFTTGLFRLNRGYSPATLLA